MQLATTFVVVACHGIEVVIEPCKSRLETAVFTLIQPLLFDNIVSSESHAVEVLT